MRAQMETLAAAVGAAPASAARATPPPQAEDADGDDPDGDELTLFAREFSCEGMALPTRAQWLMIGVDVCGTVVRSNRVPAGPSVAFEWDAEVLAGPGSEL